MKNIKLGYQIYFFLKLKIETCDALMAINMGPVFIDSNNTTLLYEARKLNNAIFRFECPPWYSNLKLILMYSTSKLHSMAKVNLIKTKKIWKFYEVWKGEGVIFLLNLWWLCLKFFSFTQIGRAVTGRKWDVVGMQSRA